jgi:hypothetical protein
VTAQTPEKPVVQHPETGWAEARRLRRRSVRTCLPAVEDCVGPHQDHTGSEWNIVRGED